MNDQELLSVVQEYGSPLYVYDTAVMQAQYKRLQQAFTGVNKLRVHYAVKALSNISVLKYLHSLGAEVADVL